MERKLVTILTPTYNRAYILPDLYESLIYQTSFNFNWVIVDDGSSDNTREIIESWIKEKKPFDLLYLYKHNGGKHRAINYALSYIESEYVFIVDSDDKLISEAIENIELWIHSIKHFDDFAGVAGLRGYDENNKIGTFPKLKNNMHYIDSSNIQRRKNHLLGDKAEIYKTKILKKYLFPEFEGETFVTEGVVWNKIALDGYKIRWFDKIIYIGNYLNDGLTKNLDNLRHNNINGYFEEVKVEFMIPGIYKYWVLGRCFGICMEKGMNLKKVKNILKINSVQYCIGIWIRSIQLLYDRFRRLRLI